jgi:tRNA-binding EMAP/Myf-like protein
MFLANLDPKPMAGKVSQGMLFAADGPEKPILIEAPNDLAPGTMLR